MSEISLESLSGRERYGLLTGLIVPRPIAWVSTLSNEGVRNLAPFSYFSGVSSSPPLVSLSIADRPDGRVKDTFKNMRDTGVYCINLVEEEHAEAMNLSSGAYEPGVDEFELTELLAKPCEEIKGNRIAGARAVMECKLINVHIYGRAKSAGGKGLVRLCIGEVLHAFVDDALLDDNARIDAEKIGSIGRMSGGHYVKLGKRFVLDRPKI